MRRCRLRSNLHYVLVRGKGWSRHGPFPRRAMPREQGAFNAQRRSTLDSLPYLSSSILLTSSNPIEEVESDQDSEGSLRRGKESKTRVGQQTSPRTNQPTGDDRTPRSSVRGIVAGTKSLSVFADCSELPFPLFKDKYQSELSGRSQDESGNAAEPKMRGAPTGGPSSGPDATSDTTASDSGSRRIMMRPQAILTNALPKTRQDGPNTPATAPVGSIPLMSPTPSDASTASSPGGGLTPTSPFRKRRPKQMDDITVTWETWHPRPPAVRGEEKLLPKLPNSFRSRRRTTDSSDERPAECREAPLSLFCARDKGI